MIDTYRIDGSDEHKKLSDTRRKVIAKSVAAVAAVACAVLPSGCASGNDRSSSETCMYDVERGDTLSEIAVQVSPADASAMKVVENREMIEQLNNDYGGGLVAHPNGINPDHDLKISCDQLETVVARSKAESDFPDVHVYKLPNNEQN